MPLRARFLFSIALLLAAGLAASASAQQASSSAALSPVSSLPPTYTVIGTDASGYQIVSTTDPSVMTQSAYPWSLANTDIHNGANGSGALYAMPNTNFTVSNAGTITLQATGSPAAASGNALAQGQTALNADEGCTILLCFAGGAAAASTPQCQPALDALSQLIRLGQSAPACSNVWDGSVAYQPAKCAAPWQLKTTGWDQFSCQALYAPPTPLALANAESWQAQTRENCGPQGDPWGGTLCYGGNSTIVAGNGGNGYPPGTYAVIYPDDNFIYYDGNPIFVPAGYGVLFYSDGSSVPITPGGSYGNGTSTAASGAGGTGTDGDSSGNAGNGNAGDL